MDCKIDNIVVYTMRVSRDYFASFYEQLQHAESLGQIPKLLQYIGKKLSGYHYNLNIGEGSGAISVGYKHNTCKESDNTFTMRIEFNPQKDTGQNNRFWSIYNKIFNTHERLIKHLDIAFDVPVDISNVFCMPLTGKQKGYFKNTKYYGSPGNHGRLKIYDKKKELEEKQKINIEHEHLTRIEYSFHFDEPITVQILSKYNPMINSFYKISMLNLEGVRGEIKACLLAVQNDLVEMKEFTRTTKGKIKKALDNMVELDLDAYYQKALPNNLKLITSYFSIV